jgi:plastocyanin
MGARLSALLLGRGWGMGGGIVKFGVLAIVIAYAAWLSGTNVANAADSPSVTMITSSGISKFVQSTINIDPGTTVKWTATGGLPHTITADGCADSRAGACTFDSGTETFVRADTARSTYEFKFNNPGIYSYFCRIHGAPGGVGQSGIIVVGAGGAEPKTASQLRPNVSAVIYSPSEGQTIAGDKVNVRLGANGANLRAPVNGQTDPLYGHFNLVLDTTVDMANQIGAGPSVIRSNTRDAVLENVRPGAHTLTAVWTYDNNVPPQPPITWTVRFTTTAGPAGPAAGGVPAGGPQITPPSTGDAGLAGASSLALWQMLIAPVIVAVAGVIVLRRAGNRV